MAWLTDTFDRADSSLDASNGWVERNGDYSIVSNEAFLTTNPSTDAVVAYNATGVNSANYYVEAGCKYTATSGNTWLGVGGRRVNFGTADSNSYIALLNQGSGVLRLYKRISAAYTQLGEYAFTILDDVVYTVRLIMDGSTISVNLDGTQRISVTDTSLTAQGDYCLHNGSGGSGTGYTWTTFEADALVAGGVVINRTLSEPVSISDNLGGANKGRNRILSEVLAIADSSTSVRNRVRLVSDFATVVDNLLRGTVRNITLVEGAVISDSLLRVLSTVRNLNEPVSVVDQIFRRITVNRQLTDSLVVIDSLISTINQGANVISRILSELILVSDSNERFTRLVRVYTDSIAISDFTQRFIQLNRSLTDAGAVSDSISQASLTINRSLTDIANTVDQLLAIKRIDRNLVDSVDIYDQLSISISRLISTIIRDAISGITSSKANSGIKDKNEGTGI